MRLRPIRTYWSAPDILTFGLFDRVLSRTIDRLVRLQDRRTDRSWTRR